MDADSKLDRENRCSRAGAADRRSADGGAVRGGGFELGPHPQSTLWTVSVVLLLNINRAHDIVRKMRLNTTNYAQFEFFFSALVSLEILLIYKIVILQLAKFNPPPFGNQDVHSHCNCIYFQGPKLKLFLRADGRGGGLKFNVNQSHKWQISEQDFHLHVICY